MTDHELEQRLRAWYRVEIPSDEAAPADLRAQLAALPVAIPVPLRRRAPRRGLTLLAAAALLTTAIVGSALLTGSTSSRRAVAPPSVAPPSVAPPSVAPSSGLPSAEAPTDRPVAGVIVYTRWKALRDGEEDCRTTARICHRATVFISNDDGSDEHVLVPGPYSYLLAASPVGPTVLVRRRDADGDHTYLTEVSGYRSVGSKRIATHRVPRIGTASRSHRTARAWPGCARSWTSARSSRSWTWPRERSRSSPRRSTSPRDPAGRRMDPASRSRTS